MKTPIFSFVSGIFVLSSFFSNDVITNSAHAALSSSATQIPKIAPQAQLYLDQSFQKLLSSPKDWHIPSNNPGQLYVRDGYLVLDGRKQLYQPTSILFPSRLNQLTRYRIEVDFTCQDPLQPSRWMGVMYGGQQNTSTALPAHYYQFAVRADATLTNGTEFGLRNPNGAWSIQQKAAYTEKLQPNKNYHLSIVVFDQHIQHYINDELVHDVQITPTNRQHLNGQMGLAVAGAVLKVKRVQVYDQTTAMPYIRTQAPIIQSQSQIASAPSLIHQPQSLDVASEGHQVIYGLNDELNLQLTDGTELQPLSRWLNQRNQKQLLILNIQHASVLKKLYAQKNQFDLNDVAIMSSDPQILKNASVWLPQVRTILDLSHMQITRSDRSTWLSIKTLTNQSDAHIVILPEGLLNKEAVQFVQQHLLSVWAKIDNEQQLQHEAELSKVLLTGVNGVIAPQITALSRVLDKFPKNTLLRQPFVIAHRGVPSQEDENTLESAKLAVQAGAELIENDVHLTLDKQIVIMHDDTVNRMTNGQGRVDQLSLAQIQQFTTKQRGRQIPTLADFFTAFKNDPQRVHMIELKSADPELIQVLKNQIEQYQVQDQVVITSFYHDQLKHIKKSLGGLSTGILVGSMPNLKNTQKNVQAIAQATQSHHSSYHPAYRSDLLALAEQLNHRGVTFWPWNLSDKIFNDLYVAGVNGITTNSAHLYANYVVAMSAPDKLTVGVGKTVELKTQLILRNGSKQIAQGQKFIVLSGSPGYQLVNQQLQFQQKGTAQVLVGTEYVIDEKHRYSIFTDPVKITVK